jgi:hypothetical protein
MRLHSAKTTKKQDYANRKQPQKMTLHRKQPEISDCNPQKPPKIRLCKPQTTKKNDSASA